MDDALGVGCFEAIGNLNSDVEQFGCGEGSFRDAMLERLALKQLHDDKRTPFKFSDVVDGADARMIQRGCRARFAPESLNCLGIMGNVFGKEF